MIVRRYKILFKNLLGAGHDLSALLILFLSLAMLLNINNAVAGGGEETSDTQYNAPSDKNKGRNIPSDNSCVNKRTHPKYSCDNCTKYRDKHADYSDGSDIPLTTDSRIKTYIYSPNEVFLLVLHYGFQSHIEFAKGEMIDTITIGDTYAWKIVPIDNRLFIRPMEKNVHTNMTIITNKNTYQFDLVAKELEDGEEKDLVYVVRFYYPDKRRKE